MEDKKKEMNITNIGDNDVLSNDSLEVELDEVYKDLKKIENIMAAEHKRRIESNQIMSNFIEDYLKNLEESITNHVDDEFQTLKQRVSKIDDSLYRLEEQIDEQISDIQSLVETRQAETKEEIRRANNLLINVKDSHTIL